MTTTPAPTAHTRAGSGCTIRAPRGSSLSCKGWHQEAALRMLMNNLDPDVAEKPDELIVYGGSGKAARSWADFDRILRALRELENDETLLVQSGRAVGVVRTHESAPRVLISNAMLVPRWATWDEFRRLEAMGLTMYGQMTAGSWIYIGTQGILQGTYETFAAAARKHFASEHSLPSGEGRGEGAAPAQPPLPYGRGSDKTAGRGSDKTAGRGSDKTAGRGSGQPAGRGSGQTGELEGDGPLSGRLVVTAGLGGMGGAQPLAATMLGGACLVVEVDRHRIQRRLDTNYLDEAEDDLDRAIEKVLAAKGARRALSVGLLGNAATVIPELARRDVVPDLLTDQTSAHDALNGYVPHQVSYDEALRLRAADPQRYVRLAMESMAVHVAGMLELKRRGAVTFDYGNNIRAMAQEAVRLGYYKPGGSGVAPVAGGTAAWPATSGPEPRDATRFNAFEIPGFVREYIRPLFCEGAGPFRWAALSGDPGDIAATDEAILRLFPEKDHLARWIRLAAQRVKFQGLPARICWLGYGERVKAGLAFNELVRSGKVKAPIVIGRDHLDCGSVASPNRETEGMLDGSDAIADWPILNALANTACGASWVSVHHGGGVGIGYSIHAGMVCVADGTKRADERLERVLTCDPATGIFRHVDAGYDRAAEIARARGVRVPD